MYLPGNAINNPNNKKQQQQNYINYGDGKVVIYLRHPGYANSALKQEVSFVKL